jgi:signal transduction histidine kinase
MKARVLLSLLLVTVFAVTSFYLVASNALRSRDLNVELLELRTDAASISAELSAAGNSWQALRPTNGDDDHGLGIYDAAGLLVGGDGPSTADQFVSDALAGTSTSGRDAVGLVAADAIGRGNGIVGVVRVTEENAIANRKTNRSLNVLRAFAAGLIIASAALGWLLIRTITTRLDYLRNAAVRIGDGDFATRVQPTGLAEFDRVGDAINQTAHRVGGLIERERTFSAGASHQLRTPIASFRIALEAELLAPQPDPTTVIHEGLRALDRLDHTVTSLLNLARDAPTDRGVLDVPQVVRRLVERWQMPARRQRNRTITVEGLDAPRSDIRASTAAVQHVLDVLIENALQHGAGTITIDGAPLSGGYALRVRDLGSIAGDPETLFERRQSPGEQAGNGIGLALARTLAAAEGARLSLAATSPTTFELLFVTARDRNSDDDAETVDST